MELFYCPSLLGRAATARRSDAPRRRVQRATEHACCRRLMLSCRAADLSCWTCKTWFEWNLRSACACATRAANVPVQRLCGEVTAEQALDVQMIVGSRQKQAITKIRSNTWKYVQYTNMFVYDTDVSVSYTNMFVYDTNVFVYDTDVLVSYTNMFVYDHIFTYLTVFW